MPHDPEQPLNASGQLRIPALRRMARQSFGSTQMRPSGDTGGASDGDSFQFTDLRGSRRIVIIGAGNDNLYGWQDAFMNANGVATPLMLGEQSNDTSIPAIEINGANDVANGSVVEAWPNDDGTALLFEEGGGSGSGSSLIVTDGITTVTNVTEIDFTSGGTVSNGGGGIAEVAIGSLSTNSYSDLAVTEGTTNVVATLTILSSGVAIISGTMRFWTGIIPLDLVLAIYKNGTPISLQSADTGNVSGFDDGPLASVSAIVGVVSSDVITLVITPTTTAPPTPLTYYATGELNIMKF